MLCNLRKNSVNYKVDVSWSKETVGMTTRCNDVNYDVVIDIDVTMTERAVSPRLQNSFYVHKMDLYNAIFKTKLV